MTYIDSFQIDSNDQRAGTDWPDVQKMFRENHIIHWEIVRTQENNTIIYIEWEEKHTA